MKQSKTNPLSIESLIILHILKSASIIIDFTVFANTVCSENKVSYLYSWKLQWTQSAQKYYLIGLILSYKTPVLSDLLSAVIYYTADKCNGKFNLYSHPTNIWL